LAEAPPRFADVGLDDEHAVVAWTVRGSHAAKGVVGATTVLAFCENTNNS